MEIVPERGARYCECRIPQIIDGRLKKIPARYRNARLETLEPTMNHAKQKHVIETMRELPNASYVFCGKPGTGKTHFMWALYAHQARDLNKRIVGCALLQLIEEYREAFRQRDPDDAPPNVTMRPNDLVGLEDGRAKPYALFFDDIDKPKMSDYVAEQVHALFDAAYIYNHQIVVTSNLMPTELVRYFERADDRYGVAIVRRIIHDGNHLVEMN